MTTKRVIIATVAVLGVLGAGCGQKYAAERDGKDLGEAVCDLRGAETQEEVAAALAELEEQLDELGDQYAFYTAEDRADIQNNLADLAEHAIQGNELLMQQDLAVLQRSIENISDDVNETAEAAWDGVQQGLEECTQ